MIVSHLHTSTRYFDSFTSRLSEYLVLTLPFDLLWFYGLSGELCLIIFFVITDTTSECKLSDGE
jgi:hypothetical protein